MKISIVLVAAGLLISSAVEAADIEGAWASDLTACSKIFTKNKRITVARNADNFGSGFIIEGGQIRGKTVNCAIKSRKEDGAVLQLIAACSTDVALSTVQFSLQMDGENKMIRLFPGIPEMAMRYYRCEF